ncbi:MAG: MATE family efflux transporter [Christensenellales bacterium]|jgi:putative MATE family efflux protein
MSQMTRSERLGTLPIPGLVARMSIPAITSMLVQALYNFVDSLFVARLGEKALTAVSYGGPLQFLMMAFCLGLGAGVNSLIARQLGAGHREDASDTARTGIFLALCTAVVFMVVGLTAVTPFFRLYTSDEVIIGYGRDYLSICMSLGIFMFIEVTLNKILQATGNMLVPMLTQLIGAVTNIILDPLLIFGIGFFPRLEVAGAAIATVMGQFNAMLFVLIMSRVKKQDVSLRLKGFRLRRTTVVNIYKVGVPATLMSCVGSVTTMGMNAILTTFTSTAVAVSGIYGRIQSLIMMPVFGLSQGTMPIMGYNFGAGNRKRFNETVRVSLLASLAIMALGTLLFNLFPRQLLTLFEADESMTAIGVMALRRISLCFIGAAAGITATNLFQASGFGFYSLMMSLGRQLLLLLPIAWLLGRLFGLDAVWFAYAIAEFTMAAIFLPLALIKTNKTLTARQAAPAYEGE